MERVLLITFFICMPLCAGLVLHAIWAGEPSELQFKLMASAFVIGLASFLTWFTCTFLQLSRRFSQLK